MIVYSVIDKESFSEAEAIYEFLKKVKDVENPAAVSYSHLYLAP